MFVLGGLHRDHERDFAFGTATDDSRVHAAKRQASSISTRSPSSRSASRSSLTCTSLCFIRQAALQPMPSSRFNSSAETLFSGWVRSS